MVARLKILALALLCGFLGALIPQRVEAGAFAPAQSGWTVVTKSADETRTTNTTLTADSALTFSMLANTKYRARGQVFYNSVTAADFKWSNSGPASPTLVRHSYISGRPVATPSFPGDTYGDYRGSTQMLNGAEDAGGGGYIHFDYIIHNGSNAGTFDFNWAQDTSDAGNTTVRAGSYIEYKAVP